MGKKNEKRVCWSCDADVSHHLVICPYCSADITKPELRGGQESFFKQESSFASPFQRAPQDSKQASSPFGNDYFPDPTAVTKPKSKVIEESEEEESVSTSKKELTVFLLFLPGVVFFLFGLILLLFAEGGVLTLTWNQSVALFYFLASLPMIYFGWKALK